MSQFTQWVAWTDRNRLNGLNNPGVYIICYTTDNIKSTNFSWRKSIIYVGMTNSRKGLKGRLGQFDNTIKGISSQHGGADRVRYKHRSYDQLIGNMFVSIAGFPCNVKSNDPNDLRVMGKVVEYEYICFAEYVERYGALPEFNDKKKSLKYSLAQSQ